MVTMLRRSFLLGGTAMALALAGCGKKSEEEKAEAPAPSAPAPEKPAVKLPEAEGTVDVAKLMEPGTLKDIALGSADAPVTIVEYASMTCPHCAHFTENTLPEIIKKYVDTGKARYILREFPFDPRAAAAFMLARCAPEDKYYAMVDVLFQQQNNWARAENASDALLQLAKLAGFTQESFDACLTNQKLLDEVNASRDRGAKDFGVSATPTFFINGKKYAGALSVDEMSAIIDSYL